jgi:SpoVK/Ycf46/Vps4 family AAA+-type ATPase
MFFQGKKKVLKKIHFFLNNKKWYYDKGIPYTIGFGLHGPPGTGKTSFIKSLAVETGRHIVSLSLKLIKTRKQLQEFFFENRYNAVNKNNSIGFNEKIIVIEDIDAQGDIVLDRSKKKENTYEKSIETILEKTGNIEINSAMNLVQNIMNTEKEKETEKKLITVIKEQTEDLITLDDILNLWDGIEETSGRIMVITSNHYDKLDSAITRPGRIDVTIEMKNASRKIISQMYQHFYKVKPDSSFLKKVKSHFYSQAEIVNLYVIYKDEPERFLERLIENRKV